MSAASVLTIFIDSILNFNEIFKNIFYRYGVVERVIIYKEKQSDSVDDDSDTIVKIFVEFIQMLGNLFYQLCF